MGNSVLTWLGRHAMKLAVVAVLAVPAVVSVYDARTKPNDPNLAQLPAPPVSWRQLREAPGQLTNWVNDHFGYRNDLVKLNNRMRFAVFHEFPSVQMASGRNGRYFLAAHGPDELPFQAIRATCAGAVLNPKIAPYINQLFDSYRAAGLAPKLLIAPSSPVVYPEDLPRWLAPRCMGSDTPVRTMLASHTLNATAAASILFPLEQAREIKKSATLFPKTWFHWTGEGLDQIARLSLSTFWQRPLDQAPPLRIKKHLEYSDVSHLFDGVPLQSETVEPDLEGSHVKGCWGESCFPEVEAGKLLRDVSRFSNPQAPARRLLIISDSFGSKISPWYSRYYREVEQFATNNGDRLSPAQLEQLKTYMYRDPAGTDILLLYHDAGAMYKDVLRYATERMLPVPVPVPAS
ncbi:hypothetical protein IV454_02440 [Massilia antarctica]|uniref:AlgX/AlgJ SGNH hydrolase-like domain-containing protein n=1 Tax=Massilia antarctica TaxID=2765360 RepID=A0AA48WFK7_9BURK|nr:hypothetical protein [Massilia antarctica]QPI50499.1 hypothetical protein IV454_02440 [Massilia antarctica]